MKQMICALAMVLVSLPLMAKAGTDKSMSKEALLVELTGKDISKENDVALYSEIVGAYQADDEVGLKSRTQNLLNRFPHSNYADNALYLVGRMAMDHKNYGEALKYFSKVLQDYPNGNKAVSAEFAKGIAYERMKLPKFAKDVLNEVQKKYPGSPESFRAENELKLIK
jgi:TolA-binding protein